MLVAVAVGFMIFVVLALAEHNKREHLDRIYYDDPEGRRQAELEQKKKSEIANLLFALVTMLLFLLVLVVMIFFID